MRAQSLFGPARLACVRFAPVDERQSSYLAGWRGGSALVVLIGHGFDIFRKDPSPVWGVLATSAVLVFFALSGFFIHKALAKSIEGGGVKSFAVGRFDRIVPPFLMSLVLVGLLWAAAPAVFTSGSRALIHPTARSAFSIEGFVPSALFLNGFFGPTLSSNGPLWSLSFEIWYYVCAFFAGLALIRGKVWPILLAGAVWIGLSVLNMRFGLFGLIWLAGFGLSALHGLARMPVIPRFLDVMAFLAAVATVAIAAFAPVSGAELAANMAVGVWFVVHMSRAVRDRAPPMPRVLEYSARFAYALYVVHFPILLFIYGASGEKEWAMLPAIAMILLVMVPLGTWIERIRLIRRPRSPRPHRSTKDAAAAAEESDS